MQSTWQQSMDEVTGKDLMGNRRMKVPFDRILFKLLWSAAILAVLGFIVWQAAEVVAAKIEYKRGNEFYVDLANKLSLSGSLAGLSDTLYGEKESTSLPDYEAMKNGAVIEDPNALTNEEKRELAVINAKLSILQKQNPDTVGWIHIPGTNIDYPIMMPPKDRPDYYLNHSFTGAELSHGSIFLEPICDSEILSNKNTIIVGHNIRTQGMMFNQLLKFTDKDFFDSHSEIYIYTGEGKFVFTLFSFYKVDQMYNFRQTRFSDGNAFLKYIRVMQNNSWYQRQGVTFSEDDRIITLYTCTNENIKTNRYVAVAVLTSSLLGP